MADMPEHTSFQSDESRQSIILSFWLVAVFLGVPIWWQTTLTERLALPKSQVDAWSALGKCPIRFEVRVGTPTNGAVNQETLQKSLELTRFLGEQGSRVDVETVQCMDLIVYESMSDFIEIDHSSDLFHRSDDVELDHHDGYIGKSQLKLSKFDDPLHLLQLLAPWNEGMDPVPYSPRFKLMFALMNEDSTDGDFIRSWEIKDAISSLLTASLSNLEPVYNFSIVTRIEHFAPLGLDRPITSVQIGEENVYIVEETDLVAFISEADWNLASPISNDPVLHFVVWVPKTSHRPLKIRKSDGTILESGSFIRPQWGSIIIHNPSPLTFHSDSVSLIPFQPSSSTLSATDLEQVIKTVHTQLLSLIGVSTLPVPLKDYPGVHGLQVDALLRRRILETVLDAIRSLHAILELVEQQTSMRVGKDVQGQVQGALSELSQVKRLLSSMAPLADAARHARKAQLLANKAFFNPSMLALLYFPNEHKYAVYTPLFGPIAVPLLTAAFKELKAWKRKRREAKQAKTVKVE